MNRHGRFAIPLVFAFILLISGYTWVGVSREVRVSQEALQVYSSTEEYLRRFDPEQYMRAGTDYYNPRYSPHRLDKPLDQIDLASDYPFQYIEQVENQLRNVDRRTALKGIFAMVTSSAKSDHERHLAVLNFLYKAAHHNQFVQPTYENKQAVLDPLVLLELGEMRCGAVARVAADLFDAAGYRTRLVQAHSHVAAEIYYDEDWHLFDADLAGGPPVMIAGRIPSVAELANDPFLIDRVPSHFEAFVSPRQSYYGGPSGSSGGKSAIYPSYYYFAKKPLSKLAATYYYKTATPEEAANSEFYGWNYYETTTDRWKLTCFEPKYEPSPPKFQEVRVENGKFVVEWLPALDSDNDLLGYRVYVSTRSRGWNYQDIQVPASVEKYFTRGWEPEMYDNLFKEPPSDVLYLETPLTSIELSLANDGAPVYVTVMPFDEHGESVGRRLYNMSAELKLFH